MLQHARGSNICKTHIFKVPHDEFVDHDIVTWCESNIKALETSLDEKGVTTDITAIPIVPGLYLTCPQTRKELQTIENHYKAEVFEVKDAKYEQLDLVRNAIQIYRTTKRKWLNWMEDVDNQLPSLAETKSHERQAAHELADAPLSDSFLPVWIEWDLEALHMADMTKWTDLEEFLLTNGLLADVRLIQPLKYNLSEIWVKKDQMDKIRLLFAGKMYAEFDKESTLMSVCGYKESLRIVLVSYKNNIGTWSGQNVLVNNRIKQLDEILKRCVEEMETPEANE